MKNVTNIAWISDEQILLQATNGFAILNTIEKTLDFKFKFLHMTPVDFSLSYCSIAIPRRKNGLIFRLGNYKKALLCKKDKTKRNNCFRDLNHILIQFSEIYGEDKYICIDESVVNWDSRVKLLPLKIMFPDF